MRNHTFIDELNIIVTGGNGGNGIISFLREKSRPNGGPNGGNGGNGGSVFAIATPAVSTLSEFRFRRKVFASNGMRGMSKDKHGANADNVYVQLPLGTRIFDAETNYLHADLTEENEPVLLASGGHGGFGNAYFKTSTNRAPRKSTPGEQGIERIFHLELTVMADVGLLGLPNAGKSTFLNAISAAKPKIASYPFTTLAPQLGVVSIENSYQRLVVADIPGLISGASDGAGLGNQFLRHLSRTKFLCQIADISSDSLIEDCHTINNELNQSSIEELPSKNRWLLLNKTDLISDEESKIKKQQVEEQCPYFDNVILISAAGNINVSETVHQLMHKLCEKN